MAEIKQIKIEAVGLKNIKKELDDIKKSMKDVTDPKEMAKLTAEANRLESKLGDVNDKVKEFDLDDKFKEASTAADPLARSVDEITEGMDDLDNASNNVADNFEKLSNSQIASELSTVAGGFTAIATSAYALSDALGITNDDTEKFVKNIGTGLSVANGFSQGLQGIMSAQKLLASATITTTTATKGGTIAMRIFNTVVKANPVGLLVTALLAAISAFAIFNSNSKDAKKNTEDLEKANEKLNKSLKEQVLALQKLDDLYNKRLGIEATIEELEIKEKLIKAQDTLTDLKRDDAENTEAILNAQRAVNKLELDLAEQKKKAALAEFDREEEQRQNRIAALKEQRKAESGASEESLRRRSEIEQELRDLGVDIYAEMFDLSTVQENERAALVKQLDNEILQTKIDNENKLADIKRDHFKNNSDDEEEEVKENVKYIKALRDQLRDSEILAEIQHKKQLELMDAGLIQDEEKRAAEILRINKKYKEEEVDALIELTESQFAVLSEQRLLDLEKAGNNAEERKLIEAKFASDVKQIYRELDKEKKELEVGVFNKVEEDAESLSDTLSNLSDIILRTAENLDSSFGEGFASGIQGISEFVALADIEFESGIEKIAAYASAATNAISGILGAVQDANRKALEETLNDTEAATNEQIDLINNQIEAGVISVEEGENSKNEINAKSEQIMLQAKKKAFEEDKKYQIAQSNISGAQGALQAFAGAMQLGPIAGPIVGGVLAAAVTGMTVANISKIKATKFNSGGGGSGGGVPNMPSVNTPTRQAPIVNFHGTGGNRNEVNAGVGSNSNITIENNVSVSETEITDKQKTVHNLTNQSQL